MKKFIFGLILTCAMVSVSSCCNNGKCGSNTPNNDTDSVTTDTTEQEDTVANQGDTTKICLD